MQEMGLEPTRYCYHRHLKPARLPIPPLLRTNDILSNVGENVNYFFFGCLCQVFVGTFFVFRNSVEKLCVSWALSLVECVAVWALKLPVPHTDVLKPTSHKAFLRNYWKPKKLAANNCHKLRRNCLWFLRSHGKVIPLPSLLSFLQVLYHKLPV